MNLSKYIRFAVLLLALLIASCSSCKKLLPMNPNASLQDKWMKVSEWVSDASSYIVIADIKELSTTDFFKNVFLKNSDKSLLVFKAMGVESDAGILVFSGGLLYIGGKFEPEIVTAKVKEAVGEDGSKMTEEKFSGKTIYTAEDDPESSFSFLSSDLIALGRPEAIRKVIVEKGKFKSPSVDTSHIIWGRFNNTARYYSKMDELEFFSDVGNIMTVHATARLPNKEAARTLAEEVEGFKTIKTIQSIDEPWLADMIDSTKITRAETEVNFKIALDIRTAKEMLKRAMQ